MNLTMFDNIKDVEYAYTSDESLFKSLISNVTFREFGTSKQSQVNKITSIFIKVKNEHFFKFIRNQAMFSTLDPYFSLLDRTVLFELLQISKIPKIKNLIQDRNLTLEEFIFYGFNKASDLREMNIPLLGKGNLTQEEFNKLFLETINTMPYWDKKYNSSGFRINYLLFCSNSDYRENTWLLFENRLFTGFRFEQWLNSEELNFSNLKYVKEKPNFQHAIDFMKKFQPSYIGKKSVPFVKERLLEETLEWMNVSENEQAVQKLNMLVSITSLTMFKMYQIENVLEGTCPSSDVLSSLITYHISYEKLAERLLTKSSKDELTLTIKQGKNVDKFSETIVFTKVQALWKKNLVPIEFFINNHFMSAKPVKKKSLITWIFEKYSKEDFAKYVNNLKEPIKLKWLSRIVGDCLFDYLLEIDKGKITYPYNVGYSNVPIFDKSYGLTIEQGKKLDFLFLTNKKCDMIYPSDLE